MPTLPNYRRELFARGLAAGSSAQKAYVAAGYDQSNAIAGASRLKSDPQIQQRVAEILADQSRALMVEKNYVLGRLIENIERCMAPVKGRILPDGTEELTTYNPAAANKAIELLGKELGMFVERKETGAPGEFSQLNNAEELRRVIAGRLGLVGQGDAEASVLRGEGSSGSGPH